MRQRIAAVRAEKATTTLSGALNAAQARRMIDVAGGATETVELTFDVAGGGEFPARVEIEGNDALSADDVRHFVLRLRGQLRVLCVQDEIALRDRRFEDASYFVRVSLDPRLREDAPPLTPFAPDVIESRMLDEAALRDADAVFLLGVSRFSDVQARAIAEWVRAGGGLLIAPSGRAGRANQDAMFMGGALAKVGLVAAKLGGEVEAALEGA